MQRTKISALPTRLCADPHPRGRNLPAASTAGVGGQASQTLRVRPRWTFLTPPSPLRSDQVGREPPLNNGRKSWNYVDNLPHGIRRRRVFSRKILKDANPDAIRPLPQGERELTAVAGTSILHFRWIASLILPSGAAYGRRLIRKT